MPSPSGSQKSPMTDEELAAELLAMARQASAIAEDLTAMAEAAYAKIKRPMPLFDRLERGGD
jgi:hypothetical protein